MIDVVKLRHLRVCRRLCVTKHAIDLPARFGENVGILTRETFGLEVAKSGFHELMQAAVEAGGTFASICADYEDHLGAEAKAILLSLLADRDSHLAVEK